MSNSFAYAYDAVGNPANYVQGYNRIAQTTTITLRILSTHNPLSTGYNFNFDYFDTWDGAPLPRGQAEAPFARTWNWTEDVSTVASTGRYFRDGTAMWSAFTGDHVIYQALATNWAGQVEVSIDGITREVVSLVNPTTAIRTFAYTNLGDGPHVLQVRAASGRATVDAFITSQTVIRYTYDPLSRLTGAAYSGDYTYTFAYAYDAVGNRTAQTQTITSTQVTNYVYDAANRLSSVNGQAYTWDNNGNLTNDGNAQYAHDQANRLTAVSSPSSAVNYSYNGDGARIKQIVNGAVTTYTLDLVAPLVQVLAQKDSSGDTRYLYGVTRIGEQQVAGWVYHLSDALGSVRQLADADAKVVLARGYTPYGEPLWAQGTASSRYAFTGEDYDPSVGLLFLRARYMQPTLGIFLARDPISGDVMRPGSMNGWGYTGGNPVLHIDPTGKEWISDPEEAGRRCDGLGWTGFWRQWCIQYLVDEDHDKLRNFMNTGAIVMGIQGMPNARDNMQRYLWEDIDQVFFDSRWYLGQSGNYVPTAHDISYEGQFLTITGIEADRLGKRVRNLRLQNPSPDCIFSGSFSGRTILDNQQGVFAADMWLTLGRHQLYAFYFEGMPNIGACFCNTKYYVGYWVDDPYDFIDPGHNTPQESTFNTPLGKIPFIWLDDLVTRASPPRAKRFQSIVRWVEEIDLETNRKIYHHDIDIRDPQDLLWLINR